MDESTLQALIAAIVAIISIIWGIIKSRQTTATVDFFTTAGTPADQAPVAIPEKSWRMAPGTRSFLLADESATDQASISEQINQAETLNLTAYEIQYSKGHYKIEWGQITGSGRAK